MENKNIKDSIVFSDESITKKIIFDEEKVLVFVLNFKAGQKLPVHKHGSSALLYTVLSGSGEMLVNDKIVKLEEGSIGLVNGDDDFSIPFVEKDMSLFVTLSPRPEDERYAQKIG
ncbi:MAG: cupin domain-containing protein [Firmicutes bacterium]|nr:cupin domain-containing protein [Bacillota bacterium]